MLNLAGLPTEVLEKSIFPYLTRKELKRISLNQRLADIANSVIDKRDTKCKYKLKCLLYENYTQILLLLILKYPISNHLFFFRYPNIDRGWQG